MRSVRIFTKLYTAGLDYTWIYLQWKRWEKSQKGNDKIKKNASNNGATPVSVAHTAGRQAVRQTYKFSMQMKNQVLLRHESADPKVGKPTPTVNFWFECRMISAKPCHSPWQQGIVDTVCYFICNRTIECSFAIAQNSDENFAILILWKYQQLKGKKHFIIHRKKHVKKTILLPLNPSKAMWRYTDKNLKRAKNMENVITN